MIDVYFANGSGSQGDCVHSVLNPFVPVKYAAIDLRNISGVNGATPAAISLQSGHPITLDQNQSRWLYWNPASLSLQYQVAGTVQWSVEDTGNLSTGTSGTVGLGQLTVATLPTGTPGSVAYVKDGRKPSEAAGSGTGVLVYHDGAHWVSACSGTPLQS